MARHVPVQPKCFHLLLNSFCLVPEVRESSNTLLRTMRERCGKLWRSRDSAVTYSFLSKLLRFVLGPAVLLAVATGMTPVEQGFYFVFLSLLRLKGFVDLGLGQTSAQILAFSFSKLSYDGSGGLSGPEASQSEFLATSKFLSRFFIILSAFFLALVGGGGYFFLGGQESAAELSWQGPWLLLIVAATLNFTLASAGLISRGCNLMGRVTGVEFWVQLFGLSLFLVVLHFGGGLWASASMALSQTFGLLFLRLRLGGAFHRQLRMASSEHFSYKEKLLPLQLKNAVTFGSGFLIFYSFTPLVMQFCGAVAAGKVGMNLQIINMVHGFAVIWITTKIPRMGNLAGGDERGALGQLYRKGLRISLASWFVFALGALVVFLGIRFFAHPLKARMGSLPELLFWLAGGFGFLWCFLRGAFVRAFCEEPFAKINLVRGVATVALLAALLPLIGPMGAGVAYFASMAVGALYFERIFRHSWHERMETA